MVFQVTVHQMIIFLLICAIGFIAAKTKVIDKDYMPKFALLITRVLLPAMIFYGTYASTTLDNFVANLPIVLLGIVFYVVITLVTFLLSKILRLPSDRGRVFMFAFIFGNTGFVGIPLLNALFPQIGMLYMMLFSIVDQLYFWTGGIQIVSTKQKAKFTPKSLLSPNIIALVAALVVALAGVHFPAVIDDTLKTVSGATSAMCMMYLGALLAFSKWTAAFKKPDLYVGIAVKMIVLPIIAGHLLMMTGLQNDLIVSFVVIMALPVMTVVPMISSMYSNDGEYATGITVATLAVSVITIPVVTLLAFM